MDPNFQHCWHFSLSKCYDHEVHTVPKFIFSAHNTFLCIVFQSTSCKMILSFAWMISIPHPKYLGSWTKVSRPLWQVVLLDYFQEGAWGYGDKRNIPCSSSQPYRKLGRAQLVHTQRNQEDSLMRQTPWEGMSWIVWEIKQNFSECMRE